MRAEMRVVWAAVLLCALSACGTRDKSPVIVCESGGKMIPTAFTFESFCKTLADEHGQVEVTPKARIKSRSVEVFFRELNDGRLLAERVVLVGAQKDMSPAVLFGLTNGVERSGGRQAAAVAGSISNPRPVLPSN